MLQAHIAFPAGWQMFVCLCAGQGQGIENWKKSRERKQAAIWQSGEATRIATQPN